MQFIQNIHSRLVYKPKVEIDLVKKLRLPFSMNHVPLRVGRQNRKQIENSVNITNEILGIPTKIMFNSLCLRVSFLITENPVLYLNQMYIIIFKCRSYFQFIIYFKNRLNYKTCKWRLYLF